MATNFTVASIINLKICLSYLQYFKDIKENENVIRFRLLGLTRITYWYVTAFDRFQVSVTGVLLWLLVQIFGH